jgi:transposase
MSLRDPSTQELHEHTLRFLVVHSSGLTERFEKGLPKKVDAELKKLGKAVKKYNKRMFSCEEDATGALADAPQGQWHRLSWSVTEQVIELPYPNPGRPKRGQKRPTRTVWRCVPSALERDEEAIERARRSASHFVLVTDHLDEKSWSDARVEAEYHQQSTVEGHTGFRWLKGPAGLAPVFLHKPERIMAMGLVFVLALMVRNYVQFELRRRLRESDRELEILNRRWTSRPTTEAALELFGGVGLVVIRENAYDEVVERHVTNLEYPARQVLKFLGLPVSIFTEPRPDDGQHPPPRYPG